MEIPFDGILTLLIFLVGVPALVLQLISAAERRAAIKNAGLDARLPLLLPLMVLFFGLIAQFWVTYGMGSENPADVGMMQQIIWLGIFIPLMILVFRFAKRISEQYGRREKIIEKLTQDVLKEARKKGRVAGSTFIDLASLGKQCEPGEEREMVVNALKEIVKVVIATPGYKGDSFEILLDELVHMLASNPEPKDLGNYDTAIKIFSAILGTDSHLETDDDKQRAVHAISKLGRTLMVHFKSVERDNIILDYIDSLDFALTKKEMLTEVSQAQFEIGICAVEEGQDFMVVATIDKMTTLAENYSPLPEEFIADILGLLAHFWTKNGSRKKFAENKFKEIQNFLPKNDFLSIENARTHCMNTMYFDTADKLSLMLEELKLHRKPKGKMR